MQNKEFTIDVGGSAMPCYLARPDGDEPRAALIVLQEIFGVNAEVKRITDLCASAGYVAIAINYYHRTHPNLNEPYTQEGLQRGFAAAGSVTRETLRADVAATIAALDAEPFVRPGHIATMGFCFGGSAAFVTAMEPGLRGAVCFYGGSIAAPFPCGEVEGLEDAQAVDVPLLLLFGGKDDYIPADAVARIEIALKALGKDAEVVTYPNVGHAFFRESSSAMNQFEVEDAWGRVTRFLGKTLA